MAGEKTAGTAWYRRAWSATAKSFRSPLESGLPRPMTTTGDWLAAAGAVVFCIAVFALPWMNLRFFAFGETLYRSNYSLWVSPWAWGMVVVLVIMISGLWFTQARGGITLGAGSYCLLFSVIFYIGAWLKIRAIIGDVVGIAEKIPFVGNLLGELIKDVVKNHLKIRVTWGYYLFIAAGILLIVGGAMRLIQTRGGAEVHSG